MSIEFLFGDDGGVNVIIFFLFSFAAFFLILHCLLWCRCSLEVISFVNFFFPIALSCLYFLYISVSIDGV